MNDPNYLASTVHYSLPGVMHYLQEQFTKNEQNRILWELEKGELKTRISLLEAENKTLKKKLHKYENTDVNSTKEKDSMRSKLNASGKANVSKDVLDVISQSQADLEDTVKEISYLLRPLDLNNYNSQIINNDPNNLMNDATNTLSLEKNNSVLAPQQNIPAKQQMPTFSSLTTSGAQGQEQRVESTLQSSQNEASQPKQAPQNVTVATALSKVDIIANNNSYVAVYDSKQGLLQTFSLSSIGLASPPSSKFDIVGVRWMWWLQAGNYLLILHKQGLQIINCLTGQVTADFKSNFTNLAVADFKNKYLLFNESGTKHLEVWELDFNGGLYDKITTTRKFKIEFESSFKDCKLGITEKSVLLLTSTTLDIFNFETSSLLTSIPLPDSFTSPKTSGLLGPSALSPNTKAKGLSVSAAQLVLNSDSSSVLIHSHDDHRNMNQFLIYSFEKLSFISEFTTNTNLDVSSVVFDSSVITMSYTNGLIELKGMEGKNIDAFYCDFHEHCKIKYVSSSKLLISSGIEVSSDADSSKARLSLKHL
ncbi:hypothetical protein ACO0QE_001974 [Hanseniaspora vineae]